MNQDAADLGIPSDATLLTWKRRFLAQGVAGLQDTQKGRQTKIPKTPPKPSKSLSKEEQYEARIKELEMKNE